MISNDDSIIVIEIEWYRNIYKNLPMQFQEFI